MTAKLPKLEDYKAPWEVDSSGNPIPEDEQKLDPALLKKKLYDVLTDRQRLVGERDGVIAERDLLKTQADELARKGETADQAKQREQEQAIAAAKAEGGLSALKLDVALDVEGITPAQARSLAKRLTGTTREELVEDAKEVAENFGIGKTVEPKGDDEDDDDEVQVTAKSRPRRIAASGDPAPNDTTGLPAASDAAAVNALFPRR